MNRLLIACAVFALASCAQPVDANGDGIADSAQGGRAPDSTSLIAPSTPIGTVSGTVITTTNMPIDGVTVTLVVGTAGSGDGRTTTATTDAAGAFNFTAVPGGSNVQLYYSKAGFAPARVAVTVPGAAGNFPVNNANGNAGSVMLTQLTWKATFSVFSWRGIPAKGAKAFLDVTPASFQTISGSVGSSAGTFTATGVVGDDGTLSFDGIPDPAELARITFGATYTLSIGAWDANDDKKIDALGVVRSYSAATLFTGVQQPIILADPRVGQPLAIAASNLESFDFPLSEPYRNAVNGSEPVTIVFNQPISSGDASQVIKVVAEDCQSSVSVMTQPIGNNALRISPAAPWQAGTRYNIAVRVTGLDSGDTQQFIGYFFAIDPSTPRTLGTAAAVQVRKLAGATNTSAYQAGDSMYVVFDAPVSFQTGGAAARALFDFDLDGDGMKDHPGEINNTTGAGFSITNAEQLTANDPAAGTFTCKQSGYASRWRINFAFPPLSTVSAIPSGTKLVVKFPKDTSSAATYQTVWGVPVATDVSGNLSILP